MRKIKFLLIISMILFNSCNQYAKPVFVATSNPVYAILSEIIGARGKVVLLVQPGVSPHTFSPKPSDMYKVQASQALFYMSDNLDGWAASLPAEKKIELIELLPEEFRMYFEEAHSHGNEKIDKMHGNIDPHFWTDPLAVKAILPKLVDTLSKLDPANASVYKTNSMLFEKRLDLLDKQVEQILQNVKGKPVFLFHPSFRYMLKRYRLIYMGAIETAPGKEPTAQSIIDLAALIDSSGAKAIFSEPQLPESPAKIVAEAANVNIFVLDPVGGVKGRVKYSDLIIFNARILQRALE